MNKHFQNYVWKMGKPYGKGIVDLSNPVSYKIVVDPYYRRFSIEKYNFNVFEKMVYDSLLLDFRHLKPIDQNAWERIELNDVTSNLKKCLIRNHDDRFILQEQLFYEQNRCKSCQLYSIHGFLISIHRLYYTDLGDLFNGVILFDLEDKPVMIKKYELDSESQEFTHLIEENWDMEFFPIEEVLCQK